MHQINLNPMMIRLTLFLTFQVIAFIHVSWSQSIYFPPTNDSEWETMSPQSLNYCDEKIDSLYAYLEKEETNSFILLKNGKIVLEKYFNSYTKDSVSAWNSAAKSLMATLIGIANTNDELSLNEPTSTYLGEGWTSLTKLQEDSITVWHQLTMTTGLDEREPSCFSPECLTYKTSAGSRWYYHNGPYTLLKDVLQSASGKNLNIFSNQHLENKIGMSGFWFQVGDFNLYISKARDMARFGLLIQNEGFWGTQPVLNDAVYFENMVNSSQSLNPSYGYLWWLNGKNSFIAPGGPTSFPGPIAPDAPTDMIAAAGFEGQYISISPSEGMVLVRQGKSNSNSEADLKLLNSVWKKVLALNCNPNALLNDEELDRIYIYPNPAKQHIQIENIPFSTFKIVITNGVKTIYESENATNIFNSFAPGIYFLTIKNGSRSITKKLII